MFIGDRVAVEVWGGRGLPGDVVDEWCEREGRVVGTDGEHLDVRINGGLDPVRVVTVHRAFVTRSFAAPRSRRPHPRTPDVHGAAPAKEAR